MQDNDLAEVYAKMQRDAFAVSDRLAALIKATPGQAGSVAAIDSMPVPYLPASFEPEGEIDDATAMSKLRPSSDAARVKPVMACLVAV